MRPVNRGDVPKDKDGHDKIYKTYGDARGDLISRMGQYCSYCNQKLPAALAVEHIQPKSADPELELIWSNFLLGCVNCNSIKGKKIIDSGDYLWPDIHNTHMAYIYEGDGTVAVNHALSEQLKIKASNMLELVGLHRNSDMEGRASDRRRFNRKQVYDKAHAILKIFETCIAKGAELEASKLILEVAVAEGFFSIWFNTFRDYKNIRLGLIRTFLGTATEGFDREGNPIKRTEDL